MENLGMLAQLSLQALRALDSHRNVEVRLQNDMIAFGDKQLLQVAMDNLIVNAWKYSSKRDRAVIEFGQTQKDGRSVYFVRDNGAGFDQNYVGKLFGAFQRLHSADEFDGTGIGLATVKRFISRHAGRIRAEGEVGKGACFYFTLGFTEAIIGTQPGNQKSAVTA